MTPSKTRKTALEFLAAYADPDINKRLYFDVWADRTGLTVATKHRVWREVRRLTHQLAARAREAARRRNAAARAPKAGVGCHRQASAPMPSEPAR